MNKTAMLAGLEHFSSPKFNPDETMMVYTHPPKDDRSPGHQEHLEWWRVAETALEYIEAVERAQWFIGLPDDQQFQHLRQAVGKAQDERREADRLRQQNKRQAEMIAELQAKLDLAEQAVRA